jgi:hypothetical protein
LRRQIENELSNKNPVLWATSSDKARQQAVDAELRKRGYDVPLEPQRPVFNPFAGGINRIGEINDHMKDPGNAPATAYVDITPNPVFQAGLAIDRPGLVENIKQSMEEDPGEWIELPDRISYGEAARVTFETNREIFVFKRRVVVDGETREQWILIPGTDLGVKGIQLEAGDEPLYHTHPPREQFEPPSAGDQFALDDWGLGMGWVVSVNKKGEVRLYRYGPEKRPRPQ